MTLPTIRKQIIDAVLSALNTGTPIGVPTATRLRLSMVDTAQHPTLSVYPGKESVIPATNRASPVVRRALEVILEYRVMGDDPDVLLDPLIGWGSEAMAGLTSALINDVLESELMQQFELGRSLIGLGRHVFLIHYQTRRSDQGLAA